VLARTLRAYDPQATLNRGYAIARAADGRILRAASAAAAGQHISVQLAKGRLTAQITPAAPRVSSNSA
jgi:exodeoxyribonuclease VII large subunit